MSANVFLQEFSVKYGARRARDLTPSACAKHATTWKSAEERATFLRTPLTATGLFCFDAGQQGRSFTASYAEADSTQEPGVAVAGAPLISHLVWRARAWSCARR